MELRKGKAAVMRGREGWATIGREDTEYTMHANQVAMLRVVNVYMNWAAELDWTGRARLGGLLGCSGSVHGTNINASDKQKSNNQTTKQAIFGISFSPAPAPACA
jgi:hypothetical protein